ncbi:hypothetical protein [Actinacidiphila soli]|uniref:hypothetical protein n=1 Tax=Actinacidiphila soli TaxID=2487275 RepID=UPI001F0CB940|nr:hypothetical protein [Actinacidiphila soli]
MVRENMDAVVDNCRAYGDDWALASALLFRTHTLVDTPGGMARADADLPELQALSERTGDRWLRAQAYGASAEIHFVRGEYGITAVPTFVFEGQWAVQGGQESSTFLSVLEQVAKETGAAAPAAAEACDADGACEVPATG